MKPKKRQRKQNTKKKRVKGNHSKSREKSNSFLFRLPDRKQLLRLLIKIAFLTVIVVILNYIFSINEDFNSLNFYEKINFFLTLIGVINSFFL